MKKEDYLREMKAAGHDLSAGARKLGAAASPVGLLRCSISRGWQWWLPAAAVGGFAISKILRAARRDKKTHGATAASPSSGAAFWVPALLKLLPAMTAQIVPLILSLRAGRRQ